MRLLDTYALYCGAKADKPFIYESYMPCPVEKFITFQAQTPYDSRNYSYWQDVIDIVAPILGKYGISILQLGKGGEISYQRVINFLGQTNLNQLAYILRRSLLHFGPDSLGVHLASHYDVPIVALYSISMPEVAGPHWGDPLKHVLFKGYERVGNKKPSYSPQETPKSINTIRPEEIADAIFRLLGIDFKTPFQTVFTGNRYCSLIVRELIPNSPHVMPMPDQPIEIRYDLNSDIGLLQHHLNYWQKAVLVTDKTIDIKLLKHFKSHMTAIVYRITERDDPQFAAELVRVGVPVILVSNLPDDAIQRKKIHYYETGTINVLPMPSPETMDTFKRVGIENLYYRSNKLTSSKGQIFGSLADAEAGIPLAQDFEYHKVIDSPKFWQDLDYFTLVKKL